MGEGGRYRCVPLTGSWSTFRIPPILARLCMDLVIVCRPVASVSLAIELEVFVVCTSNLKTVAGGRMTTDS